MARYLLSLFQLFDWFCIGKMSEESYRPEDSIEMKGEEPTLPPSDPKIPFDSPLPEMNIDIEYNNE